MILLVAFAGGLGAVARFVVDGEVRARWSGRFPWGTAGVNVVGSLLLGVLTGLVLHGVDDSWRLVLGTGFCGGFTTFSTATVETLRLLQQRALPLALANLVGTLLVTVVAAALGVAVGGWIA